jgi:hypothetical protein
MSFAPTLISTASALLTLSITALSDCSCLSTFEVV